MPRLLLTVLAWLTLLTPAAAHARATGFLDRSLTIDGHTYRY